MKPIIETKFEIFRSFSKIQGNLPFFWELEGAEKLVFDGARRMLGEKRIKAGIFEIGQTLVDAGTSSEEVISLIEGYGYKTNRSFSENDVVFYLE